MKLKETYQVNTHAAIWATIALATNLFGWTVYKQSVNGYERKIAELQRGDIRYLVDNCMKKGQQTHLYGDKVINGICKPVPPIIVANKRQKRTIEAAMGGGM